MSHLFRDQAIQHKRQRLHGSIVLSGPASFTALTLGACVTCAVVLVFLCIFSINRTEQASGLLLPDRGLLTLSAPQSGVVTNVRARANQQVRTGEVLFVISSETDSTVSDTQLTIAHLLGERIQLLSDEAARLPEQGEHRREALGQQAQELTTQREQLESEIKVQERRVNLARREYVDVTKLQKLRASSQFQVNEKEAALLDQEARLYALQRTATEVRTQLSEVEAQRRELPLRNAQEVSQLRRQVEELRQQQAENAVQGEVVVRAPRAGQLVDVQVRAGQAVAANAMLALLVPEDSHLQAELSVPSGAMSFVRPGTPVLLRYEAYPYQLYGMYHGTVVEIDGSDGADAAGSSTFRVLVKLESSTVRAVGQEYALQPRLKVSATLVLERRRLIAWVLDPLRKLTART